jgi:alpha-L-fucosidase
MAVHHDNFDLWNSKHHPKWNSVATGPKKDIVTLFREATRRAGLRFAVSEHLSNSFSWFAPSHLSDTTGPLAGVPYDGADPQWADLYHDYSQIPGGAQAFASGATSMGRVNYQPWVTNYYQRMIDLIDQHQPDLLYTDGGIQYGDYGLNQLAHLYNLSAKRNGGVADAVYTSKSRPDAALGICVLDRERSLETAISPAPWQTDTCIGNWHYHKRIYDEDRYKTAKWVVDMLVDIVACNGNLMLNIPLPANGMPDDKEMKVIEGITAWMAVNSEGIYGSRPYKIAGDGPTLPPATTPTRFAESTRRELTAQHVRFTTKGDVLYAFVMGWPGREATIAALGTAAQQGVGRIQSVELLGVGRVPFTQDAAALKITLPERSPSDYAVAFKILGA